MKFIIRLLSILLLFLIVYPSFALENDTTENIEIDSTAVYYFIGSIDSLALNKLHHIDTNLYKFHQFDPAFKNNNYYAGKGNLGHHSYNMKFEIKPTEGFNYANLSSSIYSYQNEQTKYYQLIKPYTELYYVQGPEKEKTLEVTHTQNIMPRLNAGIRFRYLTALGLYQYQKADNKNLVMTLRYRTENSQYGFIFNYLHNKIDTEENGGISDTLAFENNIESDRLIIPVHLTQAINRETFNGFYLNHYYNIGKPQKPVPDSLKQENQRKGFKFGRLSHSLSYQKRGLSFYDNLISQDSTYFQNFDEFQNPSATHDTTSISIFENQITWSNLDYDDDPDSKTLYFYFGIKSQIIRVKDATTLLDSLEVINEDDDSIEYEISDSLTVYSKDYNQLILKGGFSIYAFKSSRLNVDGSYTLGGYNKNDIILNASLHQYLGTEENNWGKLILEGSYNLKQPDWFFTYHNGNNIRWDNNSFDKENILSFKAHYKYKGLYLGASYYLLDNYIYLDETAKPVQNGGSTSLLQANLRYDLELGDFNFDVDLIYQRTKDNIISVPDFIGSASIFYTKSIFQKVAILQPGIEVFYNTAYHADAYMPAIRSFYMQNQVSVGNKFYVDAFLNVKIKRTMFFLRYHHLNSQISDSYYLTPSYPMQDAALRFGLSWKFYD